MDTEMARDFWKIAGGFPAEKEKVYREHAAAHAFDEQARPCTDGHQQRVLEYGCGGGSDAVSLAKRGARVFFVDVVPENVALTRKRFDLLAALGEKLDGIGCVLEASDALPFEASCFDSVNCHGVLHHIEVGLMDRVIREFHRVLRPEGMLYAMLYTEHLYDRCSAAIDAHMRVHGWSADRAFGYMTDGGSDTAWCIARAYTEQEGVTLFERLGFEMRSTCLYNSGDFRTFECKKIG